MSTTSVYLPDDLVEHLDRIATERGVSRSRLIVESCRALVDAHRKPWPEGYLAGDHLSESDQKELQSGHEAFVEELNAARRSRSEAPF